MEYLNSVTCSECGGGYDGKGADMQRFGSDWTLVGNSTNGCLRGGIGALSMLLSNKEGNELAASKGEFKGGGGFLGHWQ